MREQRTGCARVFLFFILTPIILGSAWLYTNWRSSQSVLPPGLTINGISMGGMTRDQALNAIALAYMSPITVHYGSEITTLLPEMIDLSLDAEATAQNLDAVLETRTDVESFVEYTLGLFLRREPAKVEVRAIVNYSRERVDAFMERLAQKYDRPPQQPVSLPESDTFRPPIMGTELDLDASRPLLIKAVLAADPLEREVHLAVKTEPAPEASMELLRTNILSTLGGYSGVAGIFVKHFDQGYELCLNCKVAFSGASLLKIGIVLELYRMSDAGLSPATTALISATLSESDNASANILLAQIGAGNPYSGAQQVTALLWDLGLRNTFLAAPYDMTDGTPASTIVTSANSRSDVVTDPDPYHQTTPIEMALLLEGIYYCSQDGGFLRALYPQSIMPEECQNIMIWLARNPTRPLLTTGLPNVTAAHEHGWFQGTHADLALMYGDSGDFVIAVFLYQPQWITWEESAPTFAALGQLTYRFFNGGQ
ncbi:MAG: serine hydrolase [Anaerolineae bacterium]|nr:serine hydrolase [Anaerolineae bacterium]